MEGYTDLGVDAGDLAHIEAYNDGLNQNFSKYAQQMNMVSRNEKAIKDRRGRIEEMGSKVRSLGDESDLATLQMMATQQNFGAQQREASMELFNQWMLTYESPSAALANRRADMVDQEIERLKKAHADSTNHKLGRDRWATDW